MGTVLKYACLGGYVAVFALFAWGLRCYFRPSSSAVPMGLRMIKLVGSSGAIFQAWGIWRAPDSAAACFVGGLALTLLGAGLFIAACRAHRADAPGLAFVNRAPARIVVSGPYRWVRHPFYVAYLAGWLGGTVAAMGGWFGVPLLVMAWIYRAAAHEEEQQILGGPLRETYQRYRQQTGMFLPRFARQYQPLS